MTTELVVVRHGQTEFNRLGLYQGHADSPLTAAGEAQARRLAPAAALARLQRDRLLLRSRPRSAHSGFAG